MQKQSRFMGSMVLFLMAVMVLLGCPTGSSPGEEGGATDSEGGGGGGRAAASTRLPPLPR